MSDILYWIGILVYFIGVVWLIWMAWSNDEVFMAVGIFCLAPIVGLIYLISHREAAVPYGIVLFGSALQIAGKLLH